jgi:CBS domain-containing protein
MFAFELTHDANALLPLLTASAVAYGFTVLLMPRSILTEKIARRGYHIYREYGVDPLERHQIAEVMEHDVETLDAQLPLAATLARHFGLEQRRRAFPVVRKGEFVGMVDRAMLLDMQNNPAMSQLGDLFDGASADSKLLFALPKETCRTVAAKLAAHDLERLPVLANTQSRRLVGIISRSDLVKPSFALFDEEQHERFRELPFGVLLPGTRDGNDR